MKPFIFILLFISAYFTCLSQTFVSKHYTTNDGLPSSEVYYVFQDSKGYIWFATNFGVSRFDGYKFKNFDNSHGLPDNTVFEIYEDRKGKIWFISYSCKLSYFYNDSIYPFRFNHQLLKKFKQSPMATKATFHVDSSGTVYLGIYSQGVFKISDKGIISNKYEDIQKYPQKIYILIDRNKKPYIVSNNINSTQNIINITFNNENFNYELPLVKNSHSLNFIALSQTGNLLFSHTNYLMEIKGKNNIRQHYFNNRIIYLYKDKEDYTWIGNFKNGVSAYKSGIIKESPDFHLFKNMSVSCVLRDKEGGLWFTTLEDGVYYVPSDKFYSYTEADGLKDKIINSILFDGDYIWAGSTNGLFKIRKSSVETLKRADREDIYVFSMMIDTVTRDFWLGTSQMLLKLDETYTRASAFERSIFSINDMLKSDNGDTWFSSPYVLMKLDRDKKFTYYKKGDNSLLKIKSITKKNDSSLYVASMDGLWEFQKGGFAYLGEKYEILKNRVNHVRFCSYNQTLFAATKGQGLVLLNNGKISQIDKSRGLLNNLVTNIFITDSIVWVATDKGLNKITFSGHSADDFKISAYTYKNGLVSNEINAVFVYKSMVFAGTNAGITYFDDSEIGSNTVNPDIYITDFKVMDKLQSIHIPLSFPHDQNYISISYVGLNYRNLGEVNYKYKLEGASDEWIQTGYTTALIPSLSPGKYKFIVYACNESGLWSKNPAVLVFTINPPFWRTWWFYSVMIILISAGIFIFIRRREQRLLLEKALLEQKVKERTAEVVMQKEEIEAQRDEITEQKRIVDEKNKDITDSIKYAKSIQQVIIRNESGLTGLFADSFIFFKPRDIVSGDFYWFSRKDNFVFVSVVDCTGHGVPGAFMSMLGISFLNEIIRKKEVTQANHVLNELRNLVIGALKQKDEPSSASLSVKDGMDMAFCAINTETLELQFAGANNPLWVVPSCHASTELSTGGMTMQLEELRPDKMPIGIHNHMPDFTNHTFQLQRGDAIYLMSDGFEDQFGGPVGKKFKVKNLKNLLIANSQQPMARQKEIIESTFTGWKQNYPQVDDVLLMGFRI